ncbi:pentapeptide repeat-containing protein [Paenibacillus oralis]|uniref:Pentapeptide repeat-containing protein n=1 Tax=Paenibacillus oralis TaxID=2490856 RepID=A0A3P3TW04_9BACL|nr:pentapeptide repeat-containing protein [Paenibacillus oralis]RRJ61876.1 pentapeptide repeat-containing protein [Paenibacillus oralis]
MNSQEAWERFVEVDALPQRTESIRALHDYFCEHKDQIAQQLTECFDSFCQHIAEQQTAGSIGKCASIHLSLLRTRLPEGHLEYMFEAFDSSTADQIKITPFRYRADWIYEFLNTWSQYCEEQRRKYAMQIPIPLLEAWMHEQIPLFHEYMTHAMRYAMERVSELSSFCNLQKEVSFEVRGGEFRDSMQTESVYRINEVQRLSVSCKGWLESLIEQGYIYEHIQGVDVSGGNFAGINLNYARLEQVNFRDCIVHNSYLLGTQFQQCDCRGADFRGSVMMDADFRDCDLEEAWFDQIYAVQDLMNEARGVIFGVHGVCFQRANLTNASFRDAQVAGDFTYAALDGVDFTGADLAGSRMLRRDAERVALSEEQRSSICWVEE